MKNIIKLTTLFIAAVIAAVQLSAVSFAEDALSSAKKLEPNTTVDIDASNISSSLASCSFEMTFPESGKLSFETGSRKTSSATVFDILSADGKSVLSGKASELNSKSLSVKKPGTYYIKITLKKGQYIKKFCYTFITASSQDKTPGGWLYNRKLTSGNITQLTKAFSSFIWHDDIRFADGEIDEGTAIKWMYDPNGWVCDPYNGEVVDRYTGSVISDDPLGKFGKTRVPQVEMIPGKDLDDLLLHLFGITAAHNADSESWYYYDGNYYFNGSVNTCKSKIECKTQQLLSDGRTMVQLRYSRFDGTDENGKEVFTESDIYALVSVHKTGGASYVRLHGVYDDMPVFI